MTTLFKEPFWRSVQTFAKSLTNPSSKDHPPTSGSASALPAMVSFSSPSPAEDDDDEEFEVSAITSSDGTRVKPAAPPPTAADLLGVADYADSGSDSSGASQSESENVNEAPLRPLQSAKTNGSRPEGTNGNGGLSDGEAVVEPPLKRKRVHFAVDDADASAKEAPLLDPVVPAGAGADEEDDAELEAAMAAFEAEVGRAGEDKDERDADLAEAEDAREQALQDDLRRRVERMRVRLRGGRGERVEGAKLKLGGEDIRIKVRERVERVERVESEEVQEEEEEEESDGEIDLMRDWTQFIE